MKMASLKTKLAAVLLACTVFAVAAPLAQADVLLSELCDPRSNYLTDRYIEIWNSGPETVDLTGWQIVALGNGGEIFTWNLSGNIAPGQALVAGDATTIVSFPVDFPLEAWSDNCSTWNGKVGDGARLKNGSGTVVDEVLAPDTLFENADLVRNEGITAPSSTYNAAQWTATAVDYPTDATPGTHWTTTGDGPAIATVVTVPSTPAAGETVHVQAVVTDAAATITGVTLNWGTASGSLGNAVSMSLLSGDTFQTDTAIPAQVGGTEVFYQVTAGNDVPAETVSDEFSYFLPLSLTIAQIQGTGATSPYLGQEVVTSGVVTAVAGSYYVIQDGTGARSGVWLENSVSLGVGHAVSGSATVAEIDGNTVLSGGSLAITGTSPLPPAASLTTAQAGDEDWEGVLVSVSDASCVLDNEGSSLFAVNDGTGFLFVDDMAMAPDLDMGTHYDVTGVMSGFTEPRAGIVPRNSSDIVFVSDTAAPEVVDVVATGPALVTVTFSEAIDPVSGSVVGNYSITGETLSSVALVSGNDAQVVLTLASTLEAGSETLTVSDVADAHGNVLSEQVFVFQFYGGNVPAGYYDSAEGLTGEDLRLALHNIIDGHTTISYDGLYTAYYTTDDKPNGKVWDMYSDVPGGTPPYEYTFGVDEGGDASAEGTGYNREHSWPSSWYNASGAAYTDVFMVYPTDNRVNNMRSNYPYGETSSPDWVSLNGSKRGPSSYPGYTGTVFEPIDEYKGDFARTYFYVTVRYYTEDSSWNTTPMTIKSQLQPWAEAMLLEWHAADPVDQKEIDRNEAVYDIQHNRNPFIDRPDFVVRLFNPGVDAVEDEDMLAPLSLTLFQNHPNPFNPSTTISYELGVDGPVDLQIYDVAGRLVRSLFSGTESAGRQQKVWAGRDDQGRSVASGVYFYRLSVDGQTQTRRMLLAK